MAQSEFKRCTECYNRSYLKNRCEMCHYAGWMTIDGRPSSAILGENDRWKRKLKREADKLAPSEKKARQFGYGRQDDYKR